MGNIKQKIKIGLVILQVVYMMKVINQKVKNASIVQKITAIPNVKRWLIDSHKFIFWKSLIDAFFFWNQDTTLKRVLQNIYVENAVENTTFLFVIKEKIEIAIPRRMTVWRVFLVLLLLPIRVKVFSYKLQESMYLKLKLEFCLTQEVRGAMQIKQSASI